MAEINKILVVSDSHGYEGNIKKVLDKIGDIDMFIHLGDFESGLERIKSMIKCEMHIVSGNNDYASEVDKDKIVQIGGNRIFMSHGHRYGVYYGYYGLYDKAKENNCNIVLYGHTHKPVIKYMDNVTIANPGSISLPRHNYSEPTFLILENDKNNEIHFTIGRL